MNIDANNRQLHPFEAKVINEGAKEFAKQKGISVEQARKRLTLQTLRQIDSVWNSMIKEDPEARKWLADKSNNQYSAYRVNSGKLFTANARDYENQVVNSPQILQNRKNYDLYIGPTGIRGSYYAMSAEASAKAVSHYLFGVDKPSELTAEQKQTVSSIVSLAGIGVGSTTGDVGSAVNAGETAKSAVDDNINTVLASDPALMYEIENNPNYSREQLEAIQRIPEMLGSLKLVYKKNDKGHFIICLPYSGNSCAPRPNERYATEQEVKQGAQDFALE